MDHTAFFHRLRESGVHGLLLFHGPEEYIKQSALSALTQSLDETSRELNLQVFEKPSFDAIYAACETLPFFAERRIVICKELGEGDLKLLLAYAPKLPDTTLLVLAYRGDCSEGHRKRILAVGEEVHFATLSEPDALQFVQDRARKRNVRMDRRVAALLVDLVGTDVSTLENELFKVIAYAGGEGSVLLEDFITAVVTPNTEYRRFAMLDDLLAGRAARGLAALTGMLQEGSESVFGLAHFLAGQCKQMLNARLLLDSGAREKDITARLKIYPRAARTAITGARAHTAEELREAVQAFSNVDYLQVTGRMNGELALNTAVTKYLC